MIDENRSRPPLAYMDEEFLRSPEARSVRMLSEYLGPLRVFRQEKIRDTVAVFGSARIHSEGPMARYYEEARELSRRFTEWSDSLPTTSRRFVIATGGGPGIMEAANRGASDAGGKSIGLNIALPLEQLPNPYITPELSLEFGYFFLRKFWFAYLAKALVAFPGGFGTMDELFEILTLVQTRKLHKPMLELLYGRSFWEEIYNFPALVKYGLISPSDLELFHFADSVDEGLDYLREGLHRLYPQPEVEVEPTPAIAHTRNE